VGVIAGLLLLLGTHAAGAAATAESDRYWPAWRGPRANGTHPHADPPIEWSETKNVRFKIPIAGLGLSSPVVWGDRVFVLTTVALDPAGYRAAQQAASDAQARDEWPPKVAPVAQRFIVLAYSRVDGGLVWQRTALERVPHEGHYVDSSWACASPVTDGKRLIAHFGSNGTYAYDLDGQLLWHVDLGDMTTRNSFGEGSSPALHGDFVVINWDHEGESFVVALDAATGKERWRTARPGEVTSWATPLIVAHGPGRQVVVPATGRSRGYDLETGSELWSVGGMTVNTIPTPTHRDGVVYLTSGYRGAMLQAVALERARGSLEESDALVWTYERDTPYVPSPLLYDDAIYFLKNFKNILTVLDARTGQPRSEAQRLPELGDIWASPVGAAGRVYVFDRGGKALVLRHGAGLDVLATNALDGDVDATPALVDREMWVRTRTHLYCLAQTGG
jgi:outer membrane protein assembly factor BamB